jgi:hypothetical protein
MISPTSFQPNDVSQPPSTPSDAPSTDDMSPTTVQLPPEQLDALGLTGATAGQSYTITVTVNRVDETGAEVRVDSSEANEAPKEPDMDDGAMPAPEALDATLPPSPPPRPKPAIVGPGRFKGKL